MGKAGSSIGTFLMSLPVSAFLLMAVFGVPSFSPGVGGQSGWQNARQFFTSLTSGNTNPETQQQHPFAANGPGQSGMDAPFGDSEAPAWGAGSNPGGASRDAVDWPGAGPGGASAFGTPGRDTSDRESFERHPLVRPQESGGESTGTTMTWKAARLRLAELGVEKFHLEPGLDGEDYLFVCMLAPGGDPNVTRRFEAEAQEPLTAVQDVLNQIDSWLAEQYAQRSQGLSNPFPNR